MTYATHPLTALGFAALVGVMRKAQREQSPDAANLEKEVDWALATRVDKEQKRYEKRIASQRRRVGK